MVRTQIQLTAIQARRLKQLAASEGRSMADLIRESVDARLAQESPETSQARRARALAATGKFRSGRRDLSKDHDRHFAESIIR